MTEPRITTLRALAGFITGATFVLAIYSWLLWPSWGAVLLVGGSAGVLMIALLGIPSFWFLRRRGMLSVYAAALLGAVFCSAVPVYLAIVNSFEGSNAVSFVSSAEIMFWLQYFLLPGIAGGVIGWFVAAGFRARAS